MNLRGPEGIALRTLVFLFWKMGSHLFIRRSSRLKIFEREEGQEHLTDKRFDFVTAEGQEVSCLEGTHRPSLPRFQARTGWLFVCVLCVPSAVAVLSSLADTELPVLGVQREQS